MLCPRQIMAVIIIAAWWAPYLMAHLSGITNAPSDRRHLDFIADNVYLGNWGDSVNERALSHHRIKRILTLNLENTHTADQLMMFARLGIENRYIEVDDRTHANIAQHIDEGLAFIRKDSQNVLVHCSAGVSRSVSIVMAYLMSGGMSVDAALSHVRARRPIANPNRAFMRQLRGVAKVE